MTNIWQTFHGPNKGYVLELYEQYLQDPDSLDAGTRSYFASWPSPEDTPVSIDGRQQNGYAAVLTTAPTAAPLDTEKIVALERLANAIRNYGHLAARLDPLGFSPPPGNASLDMATYGLSDSDLEQLPGHLISFAGAQATTAKDAIEQLRDIYCNSIGYDYDHLYDSEERAWLHDAAESIRFSTDNDPDFDAVALLLRLIDVEGFEKFLHSAYPGKTRFSIEGLDMMVPMLDTIMHSCLKHDISSLSLGMAHRGRLNVLAHNLKKPYTQIFAEFKDPVRNYITLNRLGWTGDVKYHEGAFCKIQNDDDDIALHVSMVPNPSHLEHVNPVAIGMARAAGTNSAQRGESRFDDKVSLTVLIHGDAAFSGQGVVTETLNMHQLKGYRIGGTIHIIANNQVGFTTNASAGRSTRYASDVAKGYQIPIVHVNADDPEACLAVARLAVAYRVKFGKDFVIDLIGYRRYGHNEGDEPKFTQPLMYKIIDQHPSVAQIWEQVMRSRGISDIEPVETSIVKRVTELKSLYDHIDAPDELPKPKLHQSPLNSDKDFDTTVPVEKLSAMNTAWLTLPESFSQHSRLKRVLNRRHTAFDDYDASVIDWAFAETLAFASILSEGTPIRLSGEDVERGTFSQRHALMRDVNTGKMHIPLHHLPQATAGFEVRNSCLSESAVVGFEYGYNIQAPQTLTLWEAQYGDFVNGAQAMIDEYVASGAVKWGLQSSLVMLLPHGYEGAGPDHSTGRPGRFLQLAAERNLRVVNASTAAQYFHLLRRQVRLMSVDPAPLIVMTPKSLLRRPEAASTPRELAEGTWQYVIDDDKADKEKVTRLIFCTGKVYYDLVTHEHYANELALHGRVAVARVEQLYPLHASEVSKVISGYPNLEEVCWLQEEPRNMGAWEFMQRYLGQIVHGDLRYIGRRRRASPAEGSSKWHKANQEAIVWKAFEFK